MRSKLIPILSIGVLLAGCLPLPLSEPTPIEITAEVGTVMPSIIEPGSPGPFPTPEPPTPMPTLSSGLTPTQLKYLVLDQFPDFFYCDPDYYPVARVDEMTAASERFPEIQADPEQFHAILEHNGLTGLTTFTDAQKLLIYQDYKKLAALYFELAGDKYQFQIQTGMEGSGFLVTGTIDGRGRIDVQMREASFPTCPICLALGSRIDTPLGPVAVQDLRVGDPVWTADASGGRVAATVLRIGHVAAALNHRMVHLVLSDGRELWASPGHPTANGRILGGLKFGDVLDGARIVLVERLPYDGLATYDILPSGDTGTYWVEGVLVGSTLKQP
jgi:Hint domain-containing protein